MTEKQLVALAKDAMRGAYAPYSGYTVGAALLCADGAVYTGCNIENASLTPTVCAERVAIFKAVSDGRRDFSAIAVVGGRQGSIAGFFPPCGVCRQVLREFCCPDTFLVHLGGAGDEIRTLRLGELFPFGFSGEDMR